MTGAEHLNRILAINERQTWSPSKDVTSQFTFVQTTNDAIHLLEDRNFEEIWLGEAQADPNSERSASLAIVDWLEEHRPGTTEIIRLISKSAPLRQYAQERLGRFTWTIVDDRGTI